MLKINEHYLDLNEGFLFTEIARRIDEFTAKYPDRDLIRMGVGDVTLPLCDAVIDALHKAVDEMKDAATFRGYGPEIGYEFLRQAICKHYAKRNIHLNIDEVFVSDGTKGDLSNILDILSRDNVVLIPDPVYPVYVDTNVMEGRKILFANADKENNFLPMPDHSVDADIIYLCSPNNPTGAVYGYDQLKAWVDYAIEKDAVILFDAAYEIFVSDPALPRSIYDIEGAEKCAIEFCSLSKTAGFTGVRCGYSVVPHTLVYGGIDLNSLWMRRMTTKCNGLSYIIQRAAEAVFTDEGQAQIMENIRYYQENAKTITGALDELGIWYTGGKNSPYVWLKCPFDMDSWAFFDFLLENAGVAATPGCGFGANGEGFFRLSSFSSHDDTIEAMRRLKKVFTDYGK